MAEVKEIINLIEKLSEAEFKSLRKWFLEQAWRKWDDRIAGDSEKGKLDFLVKDAHSAGKSGKLMIQATTSRFGPQETRRILGPTEVIHGKWWNETTNEH